MNVTTLDRLRAHIDEKNWADGTSYLNQMIEGFSAQLENELGRYLETTSRTVYIDVLRSNQQFHLKGYPITSISSVVEDSARDFTGSAVSTDLYDTTDGAYSDGCLFFDYCPNVGQSALKVIYTGGMAADTAAFIAAYPDLAWAAERQIFFWFQNRAITGFTGKDGSDMGPGAQRVIQTMTWMQAHGDLLPEVWQAINKYKSFVPRW
ncbi:MAG: hypothetical protein U9Q07_07250 [Planctomycetota bacterium]|nr:hypothetical protein [Planctomycetota bacterium]